MGELQARKWEEQRRARASANQVKVNAVLIRRAGVILQRLVKPKEVEQ